MKTLLIVCLMLVFGSAVMAQTSDLFISEYVEGSLNNKALEIFNGTADSIDIGNYQLLSYNNGNTVPTVIPFDSQLLEPGETFVIVHEFAELALFSLSDQSSSELNFNGNDTLVLARGPLVIDSFGQVGFDPGSAWICASGSTANQTLVRLPSVCSGDVTVGDPFNPCTEYEFQSLDTFTGIGSHNTDCYSVANGHLDWDALKAQYR